MLINFDLYIDFNKNFSTGLYICSILEGNECGNESNGGENSEASKSFVTNNMVGWKDYYLIIFVGSTIPIEISQVQIYQLIFT